MKSLQVFRNGSKEFFIESNFNIFKKLSIFVIQINQFKTTYYGIFQ